MARPSSEGWERFPPLKSLDGLTWLCRWCRKPLTGRKTSWCSLGCEKEVQNRCNFTHARALVEKRDKGVCAWCGIDTEALREALRWYRNWYEKLDFEYRWPHFPDNGEPLARPDQVSQVMGFDGLIERSLWECNHKIALSEGGSLCDLKNLETLCIPCHRKHSAELMGRLAEAEKLVPDPPAAPINKGPIDSQTITRIIWHYYRSKLNVKQIAKKFGIAYSRVLNVISQRYQIHEWRDYQPDTEEISVMRTPNGTKA